MPEGGRLDLEALEREVEQLAALGIEEAPTD